MPSPHAQLGIRMPQAERDMLRALMARDDIPSEAAFVRRMIRRDYRLMMAELDSDQSGNNSDHSVDNR